MRNSPFDKLKACGNEWPLPHCPIRPIRPIRLIPIPLPQALSPSKG